MPGWPRLRQLGNNMHQLAYVTRVEPGYIWVRSEAASACSACSQKTHCATSSISQLIPIRELKLPCQESFSPGEKILLSMEDRVVIGGVMLLYGLPLGLMLFMTSIWDVLAPAWQVWSPLVAVLTLLLSFAYLKRRLRNIICPMPQIVGRLSQTTSVSNCH